MGAVSWRQGSKDPVQRMQQGSFGAEAGPAAPLSDAKKVINVDIPVAKGTAEGWARVWKAQLGSDGWGLGRRSGNRGCRRGHGLGEAVQTVGPVDTRMATTSEVPIGQVSGSFSCGTECWRTLSPSQSKRRIARPNCIASGGARRRVSGWGMTPRGHRQRSGWSMRSRAGSRTQWLF